MRKASVVVIIAAFCGLFSLAKANHLQELFNAVANTLGLGFVRNFEATKAADPQKPGFPHINFHDSQPSLASNNEMAGGPAVAGSAADFDSDGIKDLVVSDSNGRISILKSDPYFKYPYKRDNKERTKGNNAELTAFSTAVGSVQLPFTPDHLATGDFNVDGKNDVLASSMNSTSLVLLAGNGQSQLELSKAIELGGRITAIRIGEIGREDDQQDVAVAVMTKAGPQLLVFEWVHGAFAKEPEIHRLGFVPESIAIGDLDGDLYHDVAVAGGSQLMIVHGRGQAYPYDRMDDIDIKRPEAVVENRRFSFEIATVSIGLFNEKRGNSLAILTKSGSVEILESVKKPMTNAEHARAEAVRRESKPAAFVPVGVDPASKRELDPKQPTSGEEAESMGMIMADSSLPQKEFEEDLKGASMRRDNEFLKLTPQHQASIKSRAEQRRNERRERAARSFERSISAKLQEPLGRWSVKRIVSDAKLADAAAGRAEMMSVRISDSGRDDLLLFNKTTGRLEVVTQTRTENTLVFEPEVVSLENSPNVRTVIPVRLNGDALDDLVELRKDSQIPSVLLSAPASVFVVTTDDDDGSQIGPCDGTVPCNLRRAIFMSNVNPGMDEIQFNIPADGLHTIHPQTPLPTITNAVWIKGWTQPSVDSSYNIEIKGDLLTGPAEGLRISTSNSVIAALVINEMPSLVHDGGSQEGGSGIVILSTSAIPNTSNNTVGNCILGLDPTGTIRRGNDANGISIYDSDNNLVGGDVFSANHLSGNGDPDQGKRGVGLAITGGNNNNIFSNVIGLDRFAQSKIGNSYGVFIGGANNKFGGDGNYEGNYVAGNGEIESPTRCIGGGIEEGIIVDPETGELFTLLNRYKGNEIGAYFNIPFGNCTTGIRFANITSPVLGSLTEAGRNVISNNGYDAVWAGGGTDGYDPGSMVIVGNNIGTNRAGNVSMPNDQRNGCFGFCIQTETVWILPSEGAFVTIGEPGFTTPGGNCTGGCNLISGQNAPSLGDGGIKRDGFGLVYIQNNYVGTDRSGTQALPNNGNGMQIYFSDTNIGVPLLNPDGSRTSTRNVISGNGAQAILLSTGGIFRNEGYEGKFRVESNYIGASADGISAIPNSHVPSNDIFGQAVVAYTNSTGYAAIGNTYDESRNFIAGNMANGLAMNGIGTQIVINNYIGLGPQGQAMGNRLNGIVLSNSWAEIGGSEVERRNVIWENGRAGIMVFSFGGAPTFGNRFSGNSFHRNTGLGIDLTNTYNDTTGATDGVTTNDCYDFDQGANGLQNYPYLDAPITNPDGTTKLTGTLRSTPSRTFQVNFFATSSPSPGSLYGQGQYDAGKISVSTDGNGFASFTFTGQDLWQPTYIFTATATDEWGSTSEFSCAAGQCTNVVNPCEAPIEVNVVTDDADSNTADAVCDTDVSNSGLQCSLRAAIQEANARPGNNIINFNIPGSGVQTIAPLADLPPLVQYTFINGTTQPGYANTPLIEVRGDLGTATNGFVINAHSEIRGLAINRFAGIGIKIDRTTGPTTPGSTLMKNFVGTTTDGLSASPGQPMQYGISLTGTSANSLVGNPLSPSDGNLIANCSIAAIQLTGTNVQNNRIVGNRIGMSFLSSQPIVNGTYGILLTSGAKNNTIGDTIDHGNLISGTSDTGIALEGNANNNTIVGNLIGTDQDGGQHVGILGQWGIVLRGGANTNKIGTDAAHRNVISGHTRSIFSAGVRIEPTSGTGNTFNANYIGLNKAGNARVPNSDGVQIFRDGTAFGGTSQNVISGNQENGIKFEAISGSILSGSATKNYIGTDATGQADLGLGNNKGIAVQGQVSGINISDNVISGNISGVHVFQGAAATVQKNIIGLNGTGTGVIPNLIGVWMNQTAAGTIKENVIAGNVYGALLGDDTGGFSAEALPNMPKRLPKAERLEGVPILTENIKVQNNYVGINKTGILVFRNRFAGIAIGENARNNLIGGKRSGEGNTISGGAFPTGFGAGIFLGTLNDEVDPNRVPSRNIIQGNRIGIRRTQSIAMPNNYGIWVQNATDNLIGAVDCQYGTEGGELPECNVNDHSNLIAGNVKDGILLSGVGASGNRIISNFIGLLPDGVKVGNGEAGIKVEGPSDTIIYKNTIAGNNEGILLTGTSTSVTRIRTNFIGTNEALVTNAGNLNSGIHITDGANNTIVGGGEPDSGNTIAYNGGAGVWIDNTAGVGNMVDPNKIHHNGGSGIDIGDPGRNENDPGDGDEGPNRLQNYPAIVEFLIDGNGDLIVRYKIDSAPGNSNYGIFGIYVEFFKSDTSGEGEIFLGFDHYTVSDWSNGSPGDKTLNLGNAVLLGFGPGDKVTSTATDASNNTSEFTPVQFAPTAADVTVSGRVVDSRGRGIFRSIVTLTDMNGTTRSVLTSNFGFYRFNAVESGAAYVLSVRDKRHTFAISSVAISPNDDLIDQDFTARE